MVSPQQFRLDLDECILVQQPGTGTAGAQQQNCCRPRVTVVATASPSCGGSVPGAPERGLSFRSRAWSAPADCIEHPPEAQRLQLLQMVLPAPIHASASGYMTPPPPSQSAAAVAASVGQRRRMNTMIPDQAQQQMAQNAAAAASAGNQRSELYKTELCRSFSETGSCRYGAKCQFAHGQAELRPVARHPRYKTEVCKTFHTLGTCRYGTRCRFIHLKPGETLPPSALQISPTTSPKLEAGNRPPTLPPSIELEGPACSTAATGAVAQQLPPPPALPRELSPDNAVSRSSSGSLSTEPASPEAVVPAAPPGGQPPQPSQPQTPPVAEVAAPPLAQQAHRPRTGSRLAVFRNLTTV